MLDRIQQIKRKALSELGFLESIEELEGLRIRILGKKGLLTEVLRSMGSIPAEKRPEMGKLANEVRNFIEKEIETQRARLDQLEKERQIAGEVIDVTLPGIKPLVGKRHPITQIMDEIKDIFYSLGFSVIDGPEVELDYYNFEALNMPADHPARDMQDSFYISEKVLLRTHTSPVQIRVMEEVVPDLPIRIIAPGKVFRRDDDATHSPMFHQVEGLLVDKGVTFADLKGTLLVFLRQIFGKDLRIRLRPSYFPFTEPSAEVDISCIICGGDGCRTCSQSGWLEILGSGLVDPSVLEMAGYNPEEVSGYAFGMGVERIAML
ncbi:MAG: phenylalanine--tRNA ligase subunit alpha, partial [Clostridia bacterium]|nr:phenylalanine--tRNA ligase subunit alpha [Clostridia bacterium]